MGRQLDRRIAVVCVREPAFFSLRPSAISALQTPRICSRCANFSTPSRRIAEHSVSANVHFAAATIPYQAKRRARRESPRTAEGCHAIGSVMRVSGHRFQTQVTISVPPRARTSTGRLRSRPHRTCSVERVILHWCKIVTPPSKLGGGVCLAISAFSRATPSAREAVERSRSGPTGIPLVAAGGANDIAAF
jgi:hypothetical protein